MDGYENYYPYSSYPQNHNDPDDDVNISISDPFRSHQYDEYSGNGQCTTYGTANNESVPVIGAAQDVGQIATKISGDGSSRSTVMGKPSSYSHHGRLLDATNQAVVQTYQAAPGYDLKKPPAGGSWTNGNGTHGSPIVGNTSNRLGYSNDYFESNKPRDFATDLHLTADLMNDPYDQAVFENTHVNTDNNKQALSQPITSYKSAVSCKDNDCNNTTSTLSYSSPSLLLPLKVSYPSASNLAPPIEQKQDEFISEFGKFTISIPSLSTELLTARELIDRVSIKTNEVETMYLPCVDFLVTCQQELRAGLQQTLNRKKISRGYGTTREFFKSLLNPLAGRFYKKNQCLMPEDELNKASKGINSLLKDAKNAEISGCEAMKNAFLGGMRDGESWGLRKWLSQNGGALKICNDLELILGALQKLPRESLTTIKLAKIIRPKTKQSLDRLKIDVPTAYQEQSTAHPYLPFFHRLEGALRGLVNFDPEDDDVICLDDSDDDENTKVITSKIEPIESTSADILEINKNQSKKRKAEGSLSKKVDYVNGWDSVSDGVEKYDMLESPLEPLDDPKFGKEDADSDIEVLFVMKGDNNNKYRKVAAHNDPSRNSKSLVNLKTKAKSRWRCCRCMKLNSESSSRCIMCDILEDELDEEAERDAAAASATFERELCAGVRISHNPASGATIKKPITAMSQAVEGVVQELEAGKDLCPTKLENIHITDYWSTPIDNYTFVLRLMQRLMTDNVALYFLQPACVTDAFINDLQRYNNLIKNPLCFHDIVNAISSNQPPGISVNHGTELKREKGQLKSSNLCHWNMFIGNHLIQAIDLVFLNVLAFSGNKNTSIRNDTKRLRATFWEQIRRQAAFEKKLFPTKRRHTSGFVVNKTVSK